MRKLFVNFDIFINIEWLPLLFNKPNVLMQNPKKYRFCKRDQYVKMLANIWEQTPVYPETEFVFDIIHKVVDPTSVCIVSDYWPDESLVPKKLEWLFKNVPKGYKDRLLVAKDPFPPLLVDSILIDSDPLNVDRFIKNHGRALLYPTHWNKGLLFKHRIDEENFGRELLGRLQGLVASTEGN